MVQGPSPGKNLSQPKRETNILQSESERDRDRDREQVSKQVEKIMTYYKANCTTFTDEIFMLLNPKHGV
jgi:hypothetical protein